MPQIRKKMRIKNEIPLGHSCGLDHVFYKPFYCTPGSFVRSKGCLHCCNRHHFLSWKSWLSETTFCKTKTHVVVCSNFLALNYLRKKYNISCLALIEVGRVILQLVERCPRSSLRVAAPYPRSKLSIITSKSKTSYSLSMDLSISDTSGKSEFFLKKLEASRIIIAILFAT